ncbi:MAG: VOC family protein [Candidatus Dormibacteraeota bacterium]|nr:VOC family protein [Candidatus Dormibacteraeota bacterium]MBO0762734.1 VOC family protein [Candidatus Dormibacteraeota bacterium]
MEIVGLDSVLLAVGDLDEARRFYGDRLCLPMRFELPDLGVAAFGLGAGRPALVVRRRAVGEQAPRESPRVWLEVPDARAAAGELRAAGIRRVGEPFEVQTGWTVEVADPWGNVIGLTDYVKRPDLGRLRA